MKSLLQLLIIFLLLSSVMSLSPKGEKKGKDRILEGSPTTIGGYPWSVLLQVRGDAGDFNPCMGFLYSANWIVTAAHCLNDFAAGQTIIAYAGSNDVFSENVVIRYSSGFVLHPDFDPITYLNDIALVKLSSSFPLSSQLNVLPVSRNPIQLNEFLSTAGFGRINQTDTTYSLHSLQAVNIKIVTNDNCVGPQFSHPIDSENNVCGIGTPLGSGTCFGDDGGALVRANPSEGVGIVSFSDGCTSGTTVITRLEPYLDSFILLNTEARPSSLSPTSPSPSPSSPSPSPSPSPPPLPPPSSVSPVISTRHTTTKKRKTTTKKKRNRRTTTKKSSTRSLSHKTTKGKKTTTKKRPKPKSGRPKRR